MEQCVFDTCYAQIGLYVSGDTLMCMQACRRQHIDLFNDALASALIKEWPGFQALANAALVVGSVRSFYVRHCRLENASDPLMVPFMPLNQSHRYALLVELFAAQRMLLADVFEGSFGVDLNLPPRGLQDLAEAVFPKFRDNDDLRSFDPALSLSLTIVRVLDGKCMRLCRRTRADDSAEPGNVLFHPVGPWDEEEFSSTDGDAGYAVAELNIFYDIPDDIDGVKTVTGASLEYDLNFDDVQDSHPSHAAIVRLWEEHDICGFELWV